MKQETRLTFVPLPQQRAWMRRYKLLTGATITHVMRKALALFIIKEKVK